jgi:hypothetical protein
VDFVPKFVRVKYAVQYDFEVVARGRVAVKIQAPARFQDAVQFDEADGHHGEIGHHVVLFQEGTHGPEHFGGIRAALHHLIKGPLGGVIPVPCVPKSLNLRFGLLSGRGFEQDVVIRLTVERRVQINEVNAFVGDAIPQYL